MERGLKLPQSPSEWGFKGENYLLTIGINKYQHWKSLHNAVKDVSDISRLLIERYQFDADRVFKLIDDQASEDNIRQKLLEIKRTITKEDNLVVFFSGHGFYDEDLDEGYWVPANARKDSPSDYISNSDVLKWIRSIKTHHTLIVVDSCFSGSLVSQSRSEVLSEKYPSSRIFASGRKELVDDGVPGTNSPFAKAILSRLTYNTDRVLRASELIQNVTKTVETNAGQAPVEGRIKDAGDEGGEFVFHLKVTEDEIWNSVTNLNSPEEYTRYIEYYPDGKHVLTARTKLSELTDDSDWHRALEMSSSQGFTTYIESHPRGKYNHAAMDRLEEIEESDVWLSAKRRDSVSAYLEYLHKYPSGKFKIQATKNLNVLKQSMKQHEQDQVQNELKVIVDQSGSSKDLKEQYKSLINEAEAYYAQMDYAKSIEKYQQALLLNESHFVPNKTFVIQRIDLSKRRVRYGELMLDGNNALKNKSFDLAIEYFKQAQSFENTAQVRQSLDMAHKRGAIIQPPPTPAIAKTKKKSSSMAWVIGIVIITTISIGLYLAMESSSLISDNAFYYNEKDSEYQQSNVPSESVNAITSETPTTSPVTALATFVPGSWYVSDRVVNGISASAGGTLLPASWIFYNDGGVFYTTTLISDTGTWYSTGNDLSVSFPSMGTFGGYLKEANDQSLVWVTNELFLGDQIIVTNYLARTK